MITQWPGDAIGSRVWDGAEVMIDFVQSTLRDEISGKRVLELGAGVGLLGLAIKCLGAGNVVMTDNESTLELLRLNVAANLAAVGGAVAAAKLDWGSGGWAHWSVEQAEPSLCRAARFDVIFASDVVYQEASALLLVETLCNLMPVDSNETATTGCGTTSGTESCDHGTAWTFSTRPYLLMAYKERGAGHAFFPAIKAAGFSCVQLWPGADGHDGISSHDHPHANLAAVDSCSVAQLQAMSSAAAHAAPIHMRSTSVPWTGKAGYSILRISR